MLSRHLRSNSGPPNIGGRASWPEFLPKKVPIYIKLNEDTQNRKIIGTPELSHTLQVIVRPEQKMWSTPYLKVVGILPEKGDQRKAFTWSHCLKGTLMRFWSRLSMRSYKQYWYPSNYNATSTNTLTGILTKGLEKKSLPREFTKHYPVVLRPNLCERFHASRPHIVRGGHRQRVICIRSIFDLIAAHVLVDFVL